MADSDPSPNQVHKISNRFRINLILFVLLAILTAYWFYNHLQLYVTETIFIGGTLTIWGVWKLIQSWLTWGFKEGGISLSQRVLDRPSATEYIILAFIFLSFLYYTTSSIYLIYEGAKPGESEFTVEISSKGNPFLDPFIVSSSKRIEGRPFFFRFGTDTLSFQITRPRGFNLVKKEFDHWSNLRLSIPNDFNRKEFNILQIVPGITLFLQKLPNTTDTPKVKYHLKINCNDNPFITINDLRKRTIYVGADSLDILSLIAQRDKDEYRSTLVNYLIGKSIPEHKRNDIIKTLEGRSQVISTSELKNGDRINIAIYADNDTSAIFSKSFQLEKRLMFNTIFLEE